jgi:hypothetical protein
MRAFGWCLRVSAVIFFLVAATHVVFGLTADAELLAAKVPLDVINDPTLDSQNRFYGAAFALYGALLLICARDLKGHAIILRAILGFFFAGGVARLVSIFLHGAPSPPVIVLLISELLIPPLALVWWRYLQKSDVSAGR